MKQIGVFILLFLSGTFFFSSCARKFTTDAYDVRSANHESVALLPYEMIFEGTVPKNQTQEQLDEIQIDQSYDFQRTLYYGLQKRVAWKNKKRIRIEVQSYSKTNNLLKAAGIQPHLAHQVDPVELGKILEVDALLYTTVFRERFKSNAASAGIDIADQILSSASGGRASLGNLSRTNYIEIASAVLDTETGDVLWQAIDDDEINYSKTVRQSMSEKNGWLARHFPYREKDL